MIWQFTVVPGSTLVLPAGLGQQLIDVGLKAFFTIVFFFFVVFAFLVVRQTKLMRETISSSADSIINWLGWVYLILTVLVFILAVFTA